MAPGRAATSALTDCTSGTWTGGLTPRVVRWSIQYAWSCSSVVRSTCAMNSPRTLLGLDNSTGATSAPPRLSGDAPEKQITDFRPAQRIEPVGWMHNHDKRVLRLGPWAVGGVLRRCRLRPIFAENGAEIKATSGTGRVLSSDHTATKQIASFSVRTDLLTIGNPQHLSSQPTWDLQLITERLSLKRGV